MLIEVPYKNGDVVTVKMKSGEELVGKLEASDDISIKLAKPLTLVASQQGIGLQPFLFTADINFFLLLNSICLKPFSIGPKPLEYFIFFCAESAP